MNITKWMTVAALVLLCLAHGPLAVDQSVTIDNQRFHRNERRIEVSERRPAHMTERDIPMLEALHATQPNEALASKLRLYGQFVGSWQLAIDYHALDGSTHRAEGEWGFP